MNSILVWVLIVSNSNGVVQLGNYANDTDCERVQQSVPITKDKYASYLTQCVEVYMAVPETSNAVVVQQNTAVPTPTTKLSNPSEPSRPNE